MFIKGDTVDDLLKKVFKEILDNGTEVEPTKGKTKELSGVLLKLTNPLGRLSRTEGKGTIFSCLGELLWYLSGSNQLDQIQYYIQHYHQYSDDGKTIFGAYGPKLFGADGQIPSVIRALQERGSTRKAVVQLFSSSDIKAPHKDIPCTCTLQFLVREGKLSLYTAMRSNDAFKGLPHDIFAFTMLQELTARKLGIPMGEYGHYVTSLHIYMDDLDKIGGFQNEGWQEKVYMPSMPDGDQTNNVLRLLKHERELRLLNKRVSNVHVDVYWRDLSILLEVFNIVKSKDFARLNQIEQSINDIELRNLAARKLKLSQGNGV
ncbi:thymidylate synthase [Pseudomonas sp. o96-267]|uniref:thymidylate synthase n=1 Tax=Pseudomonas sp. o96-267 TaxID=2479853 RepID=UPI000F79813E|nr:thymidylate synthase [Pseudomonas sp. o96-267]RRV42216.1 thymidylate synthase [Pseudomonas sp. o96-267]